MEGGGGAVVLDNNRIPILWASYLHWVPSLQLLLTRARFFLVVTVVP